MANILFEKTLFVVEAMIKIMELFLYLNIFHHTKKQYLYQPLYKDNQPNYLIKKHLISLHDHNEDIVKDKVCGITYVNDGIYTDDYVNKNCPTAVSDEIEDKIEESLDRLLEEDKKKTKKLK